MFRVENWHSDKWWREAEYAHLLNPEMPFELIDLAMNEVATVFNEAWFAGGNWNHPAMHSLAARGLSPLQYLVDLGRDLLQVSGCPRLPTVKDELRQASHFASARVLLMVGAALSRDGHLVEFGPELPSGKRPDILAESAGQRVFIEVKNLAESEAHAAYDMLSFALMDAISDLQFSPPWSKFSDCGFDIDITEQTVALLGAGVEVDQATIRVVVNSVIIGITQHFAQSEPPFEFSAGGYAQVRIAKDTRGSLSSPIIAPETELKRILQKHFKRPPEQLHPSEPGILLIKSQAVLDPAMARDIVEPLLAARGNSARQLCAAVFLPLSSNMTVPWSMFPPFAVFNPNAIIHPAELSTFQTLAKAFGLVA
jgi:hypothetical protein